MPVRLSSSSNSFSKLSIRCNTWERDGCFICRKDGLQFILQISSRRMAYIALCPLLRRVRDAFGQMIRTSDVISTGNLRLARKVAPRRFRKLAIVANHMIQMKRTRIDWAGDWPHTFLTMCQAAIENGWRLGDMTSKNLA